MKKKSKNVGLINVVEKSKCYVKKHFEKKSNYVLKKNKKILGQKCFPKKSKEIEKEMSWEKQVKKYLGKKNVKRDFRSEKVLKYIIR